MPEFRARAGFSPSWPAVLVQIEHCALTPATVAAERIINSNIILLHFFISEQISIVKLGAKDF